MVQTEKEKKGDEKNKVRQILLRCQIILAGVVRYDWFEMYSASSLGIGFD